jgi:anti-sigma regulatory factor (Ser/Thr protein kinase)
VARGHEEIADLAVRAKSAYASARELHKVGKLIVVDRLVHAPHKRVPVSDQATRDGFEERFPRSVSAPRLARNGLVDWLGGALSHEGEERATMAVSELVTNAATHGIGEIVMRADLDPSRLRVEVIDQGTGFVYDPPPDGLEHLSQLGLAIVHALTSRWGIRGGMTTCVWFELELGRTITPQSGLRPT